MIQLTEVACLVLFNNSSLQSSSLSTHHHQLTFLCTTLDLLFCRRSVLLARAQSRSSSWIAIAIRKRRILIPFRTWYFWRDAGTLWISDNTTNNRNNAGGVLFADAFLSYGSIQHTHTHNHLSVEHLLVLVPLDSQKKRDRANFFFK